MQRCADWILVEVEQSELRTVNHSSKVTVQSKTMKGAVLLACVCALFTNAFAQSRFAQGLSEAFEITPEQAEKCIKETTKEDMKALERFATEDEPVVTPGIQRASCTLSCCTQEAGLMVGSTIQMDKVHKRIDKFNATMDRKTELRTFANECNELVKNMTDECEKVRSVGVCLYKKNGNLRENP